MFKRIYPSTGQIVLDGGKNNKFERSIIEDNESPDCQNVVFSNGSVGTREGVKKLNTTPIGSFVFDGLYTRHGNDGSETMLAFVGGTMWQLGVSTFTTVPSAQSVFTAGFRVCAAEAENHMFIGNGGVIPHKYDGVAFTRHGVYPPTSTHTAATNGGGVLSGDYRYKVTWVNTALVESDVGPVNTTLTVAASTIRVSSLPVAPQSYGIAARRLYRTLTSGIVFKRVTEISDNTTTTFDDNIADSALGVNAPTNNGVPPIYSVCVYHQGRLFVNDVSQHNLVWYSELGAPYTFASTNFISIGDNTFDLVRTLSVYNNAIRVGCDKGDYVIFMPSTDPTGWKQVRIKSPYGTKSPFCLLDYDNRQLYPAVLNTKFVGFGAIVGDTVDPSSSFLTVLNAGSDLKSDRIEPDMFNLNEAQIARITGIIHKNKAYITLPYGSSATENNRIYQMDFSISNISKNQKEAWVPWTGINATQFAVYSGKLYYGSSLANGYVYQLESGNYNDDGVAINSYFSTKDFSGFAQDVNFDKDFRQLNLLVERTGAYYMNVNFKADSDSGVGTTVQVNLDPGGSKWGTMVFGVDPWGGASTQVNIAIPLGPARGKRIQFTFSNQNVADQRFKIHYMNYSYNQKGIRR